MKKTISLTLLLAFYFSLQAQSYFSLTTGHNYSGSALTSAGYASAVLPDGGIVAIGINADKSIQIKKFDENGTLIYTRKAEDFYVPLIWIGEAMAIDDSTVIATGYSWHTFTPPSTFMFLIMKINLITGVVKCAYRVGISKVNAKGPHISRQRNSIYFNYPETSRTLVEKFDLDLQPQWVRSFELDSGIIGTNKTMDIAVVDDSTIFEGSWHPDNISLGKLTDEGEFLFKKVYHSPMRNYLMSLNPDMEGNLFAGGFQTLPAWGYITGWIAKLDVDGNIIWARQADFGSNGWFASVLPLPDGNIAAFFNTTNVYSDNYFEGVCLFSSSGSLIQGYSFGDTVTPYYLYDAELTDSAIMISGAIKGNSALIHTNYAFDQVCLKSPVVPLITTMVIDSIVDYSETDAFFKSETLSPLYTFGPWSALPDTTAEYCTVVVDKEPASFTSEIKLFPNPLPQGSLLNFECATPGNYEFTIFDVTGREMLNGLPFRQQESVSVSGLPTGIYLIRVSNAGRVVASRRLVIAKG